MDELAAPTNEQLASFLMAYAQHIPEAAYLKLDKATLEELLDSNPRFREGALVHHRNFQEKLDEHARKMREGELQCEYVIRKRNGRKKRCVNYNEPGTIYCGLHKPEEVEA